MLQEEGKTPLVRGPLTVGQLAQALGAELAVGAPGEASEPKDAAAQALALALQRARLIDRVAGLQSATPSSLIFVEEASVLPKAAASGAGALLVLPALAAALPPDERGTGLALLLTGEPRLAFARAARLLEPAQPVRGIHPSAQVAASAQIGPRVSIGAFAVVEGGATVGSGTEVGAGAVIGAGVSLGADCRIYPRVVIYPGTRIGDRVVVHAGAVLGADGFGYVRDRDTGAYVQMPQQGTLVIEDDVEIGANATVDRGALEQTRIGRGAKLDNLVHVGHNVSVGEDVVIAAQTGISGSSSIGRGAVVAGQVGIADHVTIGEGVVLGAQAGVPSHKRLRGAGTVFWGTPARPLADYLKQLGALARGVRGRPAEPGKGTGETGGSPWQ